MSKFIYDVDLNQNQLQNAVIQSLSTAPSNPKEGQIYYDTTDKNIYRFDGTSWVTYQNELETTATSTLSIDSTPTNNSSNLVTSGGVYTAIQNVDALPDQTGQSGKYLTTDGTDASWTNITQDDHKWNDVQLSKSSSTSSSAVYIPYITSTSGTTANLNPASSSPNANYIAKYDANSYIYSTTPVSGDSSTKVATTAFVGTAISALGSVLNYKGTKTTESALPSTGNVTGDVWIVTADNSEYVWNGSSWEKLGPTIDLSGYVPTSRTVNGKALTTDISLSASDVSALPDSTTIPGGSSTSPKMDGTATIGTETSWAHGDHIHPTDTSRQATITASGILKGNGSGTVSAAVAGTDYQSPITFDGTYNASTNKAATVSTITNAINALDGGTIGTGGTTKTITVLSQTNGNVSATFSDITFPVTSVNTKTGAVSLSASDVGAQSSITASGILKGDGSGGVTAATAGTDYQAAGDYMVKDVDYVTAGKKSGTTLGTKATAEGSTNTASGSYSHAEGSLVTASATGSHAEGSSTTASGIDAHAEGISSIASGDASHAENSATASGAYSHAEGSGTASGQTSHAEGHSTANHSDQHTFGGFNILDPSSALASERGTYIEIVGNGTASNNRSNARTLDWSGNEILAGKLTVGAGPVNNMDVATKTYVDTAVAGAGNLPDPSGHSGEYLTNNGTDISWGAIDIIPSQSGNNGKYLTTNGTALSWGTISAQAPITANGILKGNGSGTITAATAGTDYVAPSALSDYMQKGVDYVTAGQKANTTLGTQATVEGDDNTASGAYSHAEGKTTQATGHNSHAEGWGTIANKTNAHAEGNGAQATGVDSHAEGNSTVASGDTSHAEGCLTTASGTYAHAEGRNTTANHKSQHVFGEYNVLDTNVAAATARGDYIEIVGNGTAVNERSNARTLDWSGNEVLAGKLTVGTGPTNNMDVTTKAYVDTAIAGLSVLPSQSGNSGKFLTTDGTDASWSTITQDDHKWNNVALVKGEATVTNTTLYIPYVVKTSDTSAYFIQAASQGGAGTPGAITRYDGSGYLNAKTPTSGDSSTKVATTSFVGTAIGGLSIPSATSDLTNDSGYITSADVPSSSSTTPAMDGTAAAGTETTWAHGDHVHPTDTTRQAKITASGILKGDGSGGITAATSGTDYQAPLPSQSGNSGKFLTTNGSSLSWATVSVEAMSTSDIDSAISGS